MSTRGRRRPTRESSLNTWLNKIQQESWQLELVISGIVIFLLLQAIPFLHDLLFELQGRAFSGNRLQQFMIFPVDFLQMGCKILVSVFIFHLLLRGIWIGAIGLRSVSGDFNFKQLNYLPRYDNWLRKRLGTFDGFIQRMENRSSVTFSLAFLMFFAIIGMWLFISFSLISFSFLRNALADLTWSNPTLVFIIAIPILIWIVMALVYFLDFITLGWVKRQKWLQRIYFPFYRLFGWMTLARFYRPLYYNLVDHPISRRMLWMTAPIVLIISLSPLLQSGGDAFLPITAKGKAVVLSGQYIDDDYQENGLFWLASLETRYPQGDYLPVFIPYLGAYHDPLIEHLHPDLKPAKKRSWGLQHYFDIEDKTADVDSLLMASKSLHQLFINDSLIREVPWKFYYHKVRKQTGLLYDMPIYNLPRGEHCLTFLEQRFTEDVADWEVQTRICFMR